jgi:hypothetical protein
VLPFAHFSVYADHGRLPTFRLPSAQEGRAACQA